MQRSAASLPLQSASCLTCYRRCVLIYALEPTDELEPAPQPSIYLSHLSRPSTRRPPPRSNQLDPGLLALPRLFQPAVPQINPSRPRNPAKVNNLGRGRRRREKAQPNKGTQPLLQNQDCDRKREGEIEDQPDATRRAAAALPLDTSSSTGQNKKERDRTKIIKLRLIANRNRSPPATHHRCRFPFTVLAAAASAAPALSSSSSSLPSTAAQRQRIACSHQHSAHLTTSAARQKISLRQQQGAASTNLITGHKARARYNLSSILKRIPPSAHCGTLETKRPRHFHTTPQTATAAVSAPIPEQAWR